MISERITKLRRSEGNLPGIILVAAVGLSIALEAAVLGYVPDSPSELEELCFAVCATVSGSVWINGKERPSCLSVLPWRDQSGLDQFRFQFELALLTAVDLPALLARLAPAKRI